MDFNLNDNKVGKTFKIYEVFILIFLTSIVSFILGMLVFDRNKEEFNNNCILSPEISKFIDNYNYIVDNYYGELDKDKLISSAISGMLDGVGDPYTTYINDDSSNVFNTSLEGNFQGIGVEIINDDNGNIVIFDVIKDSPAYKSGLQKFDIIKSFNGESLEGVSTSDFVSKVKKVESSNIELLIVRGNEEITVNVQRDNVVIRSVESFVFEKNDRKIGYLYLKIFANNSFVQFKEELNKLEFQGIDSLIIDVRGNTGGHLSSVENILGLFLDSSHVIYQTEDKNGIKKFYSHGNVTKEYNIVVLTNEASASASEILTAALKEEYGAVIIGKKTFGKGTVQELKTLYNGEQYKFTTKKWLTPKGNWINTTGIEVDIDVEFNKDYYDNPCYENDKQLQAAINYLENK